MKRKAKKNSRKNNQLKIECYNKNNKSLTNLKNKNHKNKKLQLLIFSQILN